MVDWSTYKEMVENRAELLVESIAGKVVLTLMDGERVLTTLYLPPDAAIAKGVEIINRAYEVRNDS